MQIQIARFVNLSDVFEGFPKLEKIFSEGDNYNFSWGDNNRSLINPQTLVSAMGDRVSVVPNDEAEDGDDTIPESMWDSFCARINALPDDVYIDLEN